MKILARSSLALLAASVLSAVMPASVCRGAVWYASPSGSGNGSLGSPWSLQTALTSSSIHAGDTVWLMSGVYEPTAYFLDGNANRLGWAPTISGSPGNLIIYASYSNQWAAIDRVWNFKAWNSTYLCFSNLEFYDSLKGHNPQNTDSAGNPPWTHFNMGNPGCKWINCVIHDVCGCWQGSGAGVDTEGGNIMWYIGWNHYEHACYAAPTNFVANIVGWTGWNVVNYSTDGVFNCLSNIIFGGGDTLSQPQTVNFDIFDGGANTENICYNCFYDAYDHPGGSGYEPFCIDLGYGGISPVLTMVGNVVVNAQPVLVTLTYGNIVVTNNVICASSTAYGLQAMRWTPSSTGSVLLDYNSYYALSGGPTFQSSGGSGQSFSSWKSSTGFDAHSSAYSSTKPPYAVYVVPNPYVAKRANIAVYNWPLSNSVTVDISGVLNAGDPYVVYSALNYYTLATASTAAIVSGTYNGASITIPMNNLTVATMLYGLNQNTDGQVMGQPPNPSPQFGAFVVIGSANGAPAGPTNAASNIRISGFIP